MSAEAERNFLEDEVEGDGPTNQPPVIQQSTLAALVDAALAVEKVRVRSQVRQSHLALDGRHDDETDDLVAKLKELEAYVDGRVAAHLTTHPAYPWFSRVKGIGKENIGKVLGPVDIHKAQTISALWKFAGFSVDDGHAPKRVKGGGKLSYNSQLRTMCWRLGSSLLRARGRFYMFYCERKEEYQKRYAAAGVAIVPVTSLPKVDGKRTETPTMISEGHVHNMASRKMIKAFLACLYISWRTAEGLPVPAPYAIAHLGHAHMYRPEDFVDR